MADIYVLGSGAIGCLFATYCREANIGFTLLGRTIPPGGIHCKLLSGFEADLAPHSKAVSEFRGQINGLLVVTTKAYQVHCALQQLKPKVSKDCTLLLLHNGMGTEQATLRLFPNNSVVRMLTNRGAHKKDLHNVIETGLGDSYCGWLREAQGQKKLAIETLVTRIWQDCHWQQDIYHALYKKLAINAMINPLTALHNINNGELLRPAYDKELKLLAAELGELFTALNVNLNAEDVLALTRQVAAATANNSSSMREDIRLGRTTEIDYITGYLLEKAKAVGIAMPSHQSLVRSLIGESK